MLELKIEGELLTISKKSFTDSTGKLVEYASGMILTEEDLLEISIPIKNVEELEERKREKGVFVLYLKHIGGSKYKLSF